MNQVLNRFNQLGGANNDLSLQDNFQDNTYVHPALVPLMKGDWLVRARLSPALPASMPPCCNAAMLWH